MLQRKLTRVSYHLWQIFKDDFVAAQWSNITFFKSGIVWLKQLATWNANLGEKDIDVLSMILDIYANCCVTCNVYIIFWNYFFTLLETPLRCKLQKKKIGYIT